MSKKSKKQEEVAGKWRDFIEKQQEQEQEPEEAMDLIEEPVMMDEADHPEGLEFPSREKLEDQLTAMEKQVDEYREKALRVHAEMDNLRRRTERDVANAHKYGAERLLIDLLPVMDGLIRALESLESQDSHTKSMREGIALTVDLLQKALEKHGVKMIDPPLGIPFNPDLHEAMSAQKDPNAAPNTILQVIQKGYELNGRVLRAAMVIVAQ